MKQPSWPAQDSAVSHLALSTDFLKATCSRAQLGHFFCHVLLLVFQTKPNLAAMNLKTA